jgi:hypothetical protein
MGVGGAGFNGPLSFSTARIWLSPTSGIFKDLGVTPAGIGDAVQQWNDAIAGNNFTQGTLGNRPTYQGATSGNQFAGASHQRVISASNNFPAQDNVAFSGAFQVNTSTGGQMGVATSWDVTNSPGWEFGFNAGKLELILSNASGTSIRQVQSTSTYNDGTLRTVGFTYDGSGSTAGMLFYVNGVSVALSSISNNAPGGLANPTMYCGGRQTSDVAYTGFIRNYSLYLSQLTATDMLNLHNYFTSH